VTKAQFPTPPRALSKQYSVCVSRLAPASKPRVRQSALLAALQSDAPFAVTVHRSRPETIVALCRDARSIEPLAQPKSTAVGIVAATNLTQHMRFHFGMMQGNHGPPLPEKKARVGRAAGQSGHQGRCKPVRLSPASTPVEGSTLEARFPISDAKSKRDVQRRGWKLAQPFIHNSCYRPRQIAVGTRMHMIAGRGE
jgi:hypothetical protein